MIIEKFAGPGGWSEGLRLLGLDAIGYDISPFANETAERAGHTRILCDVSTFEPLAFGDTEIDGMIDSPPCPGFSRAGKGRGALDLALLLDAIKAMGEFEDVRPRVRAEQQDARSVLVLEPLRWALALQPGWLCWEQVPDVLPIWRACGDVLTDLGYRCEAAYVTAEMYGVPQTRKRAIFRAVLERDLPPLTPTHSRYYRNEPQRLDDDVLPWVSMASALGWGAEELVGFARRADQQASVEIDGEQYRARDLRPTVEPSLTVTEKARSWTRYRDAVKQEAAKRERVQSGGDFDLGWPADRPSLTIAGRDTIPHPGENRNRWNTSTKTRNDGLRVTAAEAGILQSFREDYPWTGTKTERFIQIGNAVPPLLASIVLASVQP